MNTLRRIAILTASLCCVAGVAVQAESPVPGAHSEAAVRAYAIRSDVSFADGRRLSFLHWPNPGKPALLLLHGKGGFASSFDDLARHLGDRYALYAIDMRGRGYSDWAADGDYSVEATLDDLDQFVRAAALPRFTLYGHSYGAVVALAYVADHPARIEKLILEDGGPTDMPDGTPSPTLNSGQKAPAGTPVSIPQPLRFANWGAVRAWQDEKCRFNCTPEQLESQFIRQVDGTVRERSDTQGIARSKRGAAFDHQWGAVKALRVPTLLLRAEFGLVPAPIGKAMARTNPRIRVVDIPKAEHSLRASQPDAAFRAIDAFLNRSD